MDCELNFTLTESLFCRGGRGDNLAKRLCRLYSTAQSGVRVTSGPLSRRASCARVGGGCVAVAVTLIHSDREKGRSLRS